MVSANSIPKTLSLLSVSTQLNITAHNQGDHCIVAQGSQQKINDRNQTLLSSEEEEVCIKFNYNMVPLLAKDIKNWFGSLPQS
jgi:hypothetical protein